MSALLTDALLAWAHHLSAFALLAVLFSEWCLTAHELDAPRLRLLARLDLGYGALAGAVLLAGLARLAWGSKGWAFYAGNPLFWTKLGLFGLIGLLSITPTLRILRWSREGRAPDATAQRAVRRWMGAQLLLIPLLLLLAPLMARGVGH